MSGKHDRYQYLLRQRLTSTAMNAKDDYTSRLAYTALQALLAGDGQYASGVVDGLLVTVQAGTLNSVVSGGLALLFDNTLALPDNKHLWIEVQHATPITVAHDPGDGSPRWDVVEIAANQIDGPPEIIDFYDPSLGVAVPLAASPYKQCSPTVTIRKGTPAASPQFPAGVAGVIPLAYVYVPAGAVALNAADMVYCRPLRKNRPAEMTPGTVGYFQDYQVRGGGLNVAVAGLNATIANDVTGVFTRSSIPFHLHRGGTVNLSVNNFDGGGLPGADAVVYCYAMPFPYPAGYDATLAPREFHLRNTALLSASVGIGQRNCMYIWSTVAPTFGNQGAPNAVGNAAINHPNLGAITPAYNSMVYVGAAFYDQGLTQLALQDVTGTWIAPAIKTGFSFHLDLPIAAPTTYNLWSGAAGGAMELPATATICHVIGEFDFGAPGGLFLRFNDEWSVAGADAGGEFRIQVQNDYDEIEVGCAIGLVRPAANGDITVEEARCEILDGQTMLIVRAYQDAVLEMR